MTTLIKKYWLYGLLILVIVYLGSSRNRFFSTGFESSQMVPSMSGTADMMYSSGSSVGSIKMSAPASFNLRNVAPSESVNRVVIQDTSLSLQVKDVATEIKNIENATKQLGGFLVNSYLSKPESAASGNIVVRVPESKRAEAMSIFKQNAVKVVSESVSGTDVTDQYTDLEAQLAVLNKTKAKYEEIMDKAFNVSDLMNVQQQLINLQNQIDSVKGQQKYYEQSAKLSKVTIYLSTDDLALPYSPTNEWRPAVVFKTAVRSLLGTLRGLANLIIWSVVYLPVIIPIVGLIIWSRRRGK